MKRKGHSPVPGAIATRAVGPSSVGERLAQRPEIAVRTEGLLGSAW